MLAVVKSPSASSDETRMDRRFAQGRFGAGRLVELPARSLMKLSTLRLPGTSVVPFTQMARRFMLLADPPDHERLRRLVVRAFTPKTVERMVPRIEAIASELLDELAPQHGGDLLQDYAYRLPVIVICEMLGIQATDHEQFASWVPPLVMGLLRLAGATHGSILLHLLLRVAQRSSAATQLGRGPPTGMGACRQAYERRPEASARYPSRSVRAATALHR